MLWFLCLKKMSGRFRGWNWCQKPENVMSTPEKQPQNKIALKEPNFSYGRFPKNRLTIDFNQSIHTFDLHTGWCAHVCPICPITARAANLPSVIKIIYCHAIQQNSESALVHKLTSSCEKQHQYTKFYRNSTVQYGYLVELQRKRDR